jgi:hypothetical protein
MFKSRLDSFRVREGKRIYTPSLYHCNIILHLEANIQRRRERREIYEEHPYIGIELIE